MRRRRRRPDQSGFPAEVAMRRVVAGLVLTLLAGTAAPGRAQNWFGSACSDDGAVCATAWGAINPSGISAAWNASVTFVNRVGAIDVQGAPAGTAADVNAFWCCYDPGTTLTDIFGYTRDAFGNTIYGPTGGLPTPGSTAFVTIRALVLPAGDPRTAADVMAEMIARYGGVWPQYLQPVGFQRSLERVPITIGVSTVPEPTTLALVAGGLVLVGVVTRRRHAA
jgi:hypothetical protein